MNPHLQARPESSILRIPVKHLGEHMTTLRPSRADDGVALVDLWRRAVDATHDFLSTEDRQAIDAEVAGFLPHAPLTVAVDAQDRPLGFMLIDGTHMEALFIDPDVRGTGIGRQLLQHALSLHPQLSTDVNAQNAQAVGFYRRMGFVETGRSPLDSQGRPYPLIHLRYNG
ncbi:N-acetyltransferase GCN5 [Stenotrophomonas maltophilia]|nr:N-acetyltransferase GCN5 [Stenotrophomonas maltophilia]